MDQLITSSEDTTSRSRVSPGVRRTLIFSTIRDPETCFLLLEQRTGWNYSHSCLLRFINFLCNFFSRELIFPYINFFLITDRCSYGEQEETADISSRSLYRWNRWIRISTEQSWARRRETGRPFAGPSLNYFSPVRPGANWSRGTSPWGRRANRCVNSSTRTMSEDCFASLTCRARFLPKKKIGGNLNRTENKNNKELLTMSVIIFYVQSGR